MLKKVALGLLAVALLVLPSVGRWLYFYEGSYTPPAVPRPDLASIEAPLSAAGEFADDYAALSPGTVLVDMAHENRVQMQELSVLQARLTARNQRLKPVHSASDLGAELRHARALVVISPGEDWTDGEIEQVARFVDKGGRLLMVTDPSRFDYLYDEWDYFIGLDHDVVHINDLAARFGLLFEDDYLYNTSDNEGNFRNIKLQASAGGDLLDGVEQLVFYASHSITTEEEPLLSTEGETRSSNSEWSGPLTVAAQAAGGAVLALGDLTFFTEPYNTVHDNDRFLANVADWLSSGQRRYELDDFPFFFEDAVDLVYAGNPLLDGTLLESVSGLQDFFEEQDISLSVRDQEDDGDTILMGLYTQAEEVEPYLAVAGVTLLITPTADVESASDVDSATDVEGEEEGAEPPLATATPSLPVTQPLTATTSISPTVEPEAEPQVEPPARPKDRVEIGSLGEMVITGTSLLVLENDGQRQVMVVLADTEEGLDSAVTRLTDGDLAGCLFQEAEASTLALCPYGEASSDGGWQEAKAQDTEPAPQPSEEPAEVPTEEPPETPAEPEGNILILSLDEGQGEYDDATSAAEYQAILQDRYDVAVWSTAQDGMPDMADIVDYDLVIWTSGDHKDLFDDEASNLLFGLVLEGIPVVVSGAYVGDSASQAVQRDIQVRDSEHPMAQGFAADEVIPFAPAPSGSEYEIDVLEDFQESEDIIIFVRGPESEASGTASVAVIEDEVSGIRLVFIAFPLYLLPEAPRAQLVQNTVSWMLSP
ncbi:MAG: hypothetical protein P8129_15495 [Anaerolineae bacterium]